MAPLPLRTAVLALVVAGVMMVTAAMLVVPAVRTDPLPMFCELSLPFGEYDGVQFAVQDRRGDGPGPCDIGLAGWLARPERGRSSGAMAPILDYYCVVHYPDWWTGHRVELVPAEAGCIPWDGPDWLAEAYGS